MACSSLVALPRTCGSQGIVAGSEKLYMISFEDLNPISGSPTNDVYSASTAGVVTRINLAGADKFVEIGLTRSSTGLQQTLTKDLKNGTAFFTKTLTLVLSDLSLANYQFVQSVLNQPVAILLRTRTNNYYAVGLTGEFELATLEGGSGVSETDLNGYTITFTSIEANPIQLVDASIVSGLIS